ncbi:MAG: alpha/beta hydrolase [Cytophagaceae bacterium]|nr:alpha/beta hydrolase [Cytophagaceae bacterium]
MHVRKKTVVSLSTAFVIMTLFGLSVSSCLKMRISTKALDKEFMEAACKPHQHCYEACGRTMNYAEVGNDSLPLVLFIHGSPGSWTAFKHFFKDSLLLSKSQLIAVDRPGFGYSDYGKAEPSLAVQAACIKPLLQKYGIGKKVILVGHSLGGPLIARIAMDYPELVNYLIFVAPSVDPALEPREWYRKPMNTLRWLLPGSIRASNGEIISLKKELELMIPLWSTIHQPAIVIQGEDDNLVLPGNASFIKKRMVNSQVDIKMLKDMNHFIPWKKPEAIQKAILEALSTKK